MWIYQKKLQYPVNIKNKDLRMAKYLLTQYGGPAGELSAAFQYLNQRYTVAKDYATYLEAYVLYTTCPEEDEPEKSAIHHGTFKYHNHAGFVRSCF